MTTEDRLHPDPGESEFSGREGWREPCWGVGLGHPFRERELRGLLGGTGGDLQQCG